MGVGVGVGVGAGVGVTVASGVGMGESRCDSTPCASVPRTATSSKTVAKISSFFIAPLCSPIVNHN